MFPNRYFPERYYADRYFPVGEEGAPPGTQGGARSLLAFWIGGASAPSGAPEPTGGVRSLLAFWIGGAAGQEGEAPTEPPTEEPTQPPRGGDPWFPRDWIKHLKARKPGYQAKREDEERLSRYLEDLYDRVHGLLPVEQEEVREALKESVSPLRFPQSGLPDQADIDLNRLLGDLQAVERLIHLRQRAMEEEEMAFLLLLLASS